MKLLKRLNNVFDRVCSVSAYLAAILIILTFALVNSEVMSRLLTARSIVWVIEICEYALLFITFLGTAWLLKIGGHIKIELTLSRLNPRARDMVRAINCILCAVFSLVLTYYGVRVTLEHFESGYAVGSGLEPPSFIILSIIPIGNFLLLIQFLKMGYGYMRKHRQTGSAVEQEGKAEVG